MQKPIFIGYLNYANLVTYTGLFFAVLAIYFSHQHQFDAALFCLILCGITDSLDGPLSRMLKSSKKEQVFGKHLDTVADVSMFAVTPIIIGMNMGFTNKFSLILFAFYLMAGCTRLAYFECVGTVEKNNKKYFIGMPSPYPAFILPIVYLFTPFFGLWIFITTYLISGILFILNFHCLDLRIYKKSILFLISFLAIIFLKRFFL